MIFDTRLNFLHLTTKFKTSCLADYQKIFIGITNYPHLVLDIFIFKNKNQIKYRAARFKIIKIHTRSDG